MKKIILSATAFILFSAIATAQGFHVGAKVGANLDKINGQAFKDGYNLGYHLGGFMEIDFSKSIGIQPELLFSQTNTTATDNLGDVFKPGDNIKLNYLNIPILLRINASKLLTLNAGPQFSILMNNHETLLENGQDAFKNGDFALVLGAQLNLSSLKLYGRYNIGLSDINDIGSQDQWKSQQFQLGVGLRLF
ncbi:MAG TPA: porin family protein [Panacibacter sp.]|nr:porin family protein [Panacibacter sp.]HNP44037.1 porin family protein [Panacibacter sp.]